MRGKCQPATPPSLLAELLSRGLQEASSNSRGSLRYPVRSFVLSRASLGVSNQPPLKLTSVIPNLRRINCAQERAFLRNTWQTSVMTVSAPGFLFRS